MCAVREGSVCVVREGSVCVCGNAFSFGGGAYSTLLMLVVVVVVTGINWGILGLCTCNHRCKIEVGGPFEICKFRGVDL